MTVTMGGNRRAFLSMLAVAEGTSTHPTTRNDGFDVIVTGMDGKPEIFTDYSAHPFANGRPAKQINSAGLYSTASGRYQFLVRHWKHYKALLHLQDFGPDSQDLWALQLIRERQALPLIDGGNLREAINAVRTLWASLPGSGHGQPERSFNKLETAYLSAGGQLA